MDLALDYSNLLPAMVIAEMSGIPMADRARFLRWGEAIMNLSYAIAGGEEAAKAIKEHAAVKEEMKTYLTEVPPERRRAPKDDLLWNAEVFNAAAPRHFALLKDPSGTDSDRYLREHNVQAIPYSDYEALPGILEALRAAGAPPP